MRITNKLELIVAVGTPGWMIRVRLRPNRSDETKRYYHAACAELSKCAMGSGPLAFTRFGPYAKRVDGLAVPKHSQFRCAKCGRRIGREQQA